MNRDNESVDVVVVGGGIAGLATAWRLRQLEPLLRVVLLEALPRTGGKIRTERVQHEEGDFLLEAGPDAFLAQKPWARQLAEEIGLAGELVQINASSHPVSVLKGGRPISLPAGVSLVAPTDTQAFIGSPLLSWRGKARVAGDLVLPRRKGDADESLAEFVRRRLGQEALDWIAEPLMAGIYNASPEELSLQATFPQFGALEQKHRSLIRGLRASRPTHHGPPPPPFLTFQNGMQTLTDRLADQLQPWIRPGVEVTAVRPQSGGFLVVTKQLPLISTQHVVLSLPAAGAADLVDCFAVNAADMLRRIRSSSSGNVTMAYRTEAILQPLPGYGLVVPRQEGGPFNAVTVISRKFPGRAPEGWTLLRLFFGGARSSDTMTMNDSDLLPMAAGFLRCLMGINEPPAFSRVVRWQSGSPIYEVGHLHLVATIEKALPAGIWMVGNSYRGVGIPDIVRTANETVDRLLAGWSSTS